MSDQPPQGPQGPPPPGQGWQPPPGGQPPPGQGPQWQGWGPPPQPPIYRRPWFIIVGIIGLVLVLGALFGDDPTTTARDVPAGTEAQTDETRETTVGRKAGVVLLEDSGTGNGSTKKFSAAGDWDLDWSVNCDGDGFVSISPEGDSFLIGPTVDKTAKGVEHYHEGGSFYFEVIGGPNCSWTVKAVTA